MSCTENYHRNIRKQVNEKDYDSSWLWFMFMFKHLKIFDLFEVSAKTPVFWCLIRVSC